MSTSFLDRLRDTLHAFRLALTPNNVIAILVVVVLLVTMYLAYAGYATQTALERESARNAQRNAANTAALCALRAEREDDVETTQKFLDEHPEHVIELGNGISVPRSQIENDLENMQETVDAISDNVACP